MGQQRRRFRRSARLRAAGIASSGGTDPGEGAQRHCSPAGRWRLLSESPLGGTVCLGPCTRPLSGAFSLRRGATRGFARARRTLVSASSFVHRLSYLLDLLGSHWASRHEHDPSAAPDEDDLVEPVERGDIALVP